MNECTVPCSRTGREGRTQLSQLAADLSSTGLSATLTPGAQTYQVLASHIICLIIENVFCVYWWRGRDQPDVLHGNDGVEEQLKTLPVVRGREPGQKDVKEIAKTTDCSVENSKHSMRL